MDLRTGASNVSVLSDQQICSQYQSLILIMLFMSLLRTICRLACSHKFNLDAFRKIHSVLQQTHT